MTNHLEINKLLSTCQFGFQKKISTEHCILHLSNYVSEALNNNKFALGVFLDLQKAFDVVDHNILLLKLENLGIRDKALEWFRNYLSNRTQVVNINGETSAETKIDISVMQGSILGPLLFLIFINDLPNASNLLHLLLFADDTCALDSDKDINQLIARVNTELHKLCNWFLANKISVNASKCKYIIFHNQGKKIPPNLSNVVLNFNPFDTNINPDLISPLERVHKNNSNAQFYKYLGILIDENLSYGYHINYICKKLNRSLFCLNRVRYLLDGGALRTLYFSLFQSHLLYCNIIFNCCSQTNINRILTLQKKAIRTITNSNYNAHTQPLFSKLNILPFDKLLTLNKSTFIHSIYHKNHHRSFQNTWILNQQRDLEHTLRNQNLFQLPFPRTEQFKKSPLYFLPKAWNDLPDEIKCQENPYTFKIALKDHLCRHLAAVNPTVAIN